jgi:phospho-N-acetylmuramoyl-pentapeptide-transferase
VLYYLHGIFRYLSFRIAGAAVTSFLLALVLVPLLIKHARRRRFTDREGKTDSRRLNELHAKKKDTPVLGGLGMMVAALAAIGLWARVFNFYVLLVVASIVGLGAVGLVDDWVKTFGKDKTKGLTPRQKLAAQLALGVALGGALVFFEGGFDGWGLPRAFASELEKVEARDEPCDTAPAIATHSVSAPVAPNDHCEIRRHKPRIAEPATIYPPFFKDAAIPLGAMLFTIFFALVVTGSSNAVNLTDGLDGLAAGSIVFAWLVCMALAYVTGRPDWCAYLGLPHVPGAGEVAVVCAALAGGTVGFLWFNVHPAEIFMGDAGALPLGGALGVVALATKHELLLPVIGGVFVAEALSVMAQVAWFKLTGKRLLLCAPLHHHFEFRGWPETKVVARFQIVAAILAIAALATLKVR